MNDRTKKIKCKLCKGTGHEDHQTPCYDCGGSGDAERHAEKMIDEWIEGDIQRRRADWAAQDRKREVTKARRPL